MEDSEVTEMIEQLRTEMQEQIDIVRSDLDEEIEGLRARIQHLERTTHNF
jgi:hypothetical protein